MQRYLNHLIADLEAAIRSAPDASTYRFVPRFMDEDEEEGAVLQSRFVRLSELFCIAPEAFPPVTRLNKVQVTSLLTAIENLWRAWHISWECPSKLTARRRYTIMVEKMSTSIRYHYDLGARIDFCEGHQEGKCPFEDKGQCWCAEVASNALNELDEWQTVQPVLLGPDFVLDFETDDTSPVEAFNRWLKGDEMDFDPWDYDEGKERYEQFVAEEDMMAWLYFYQPQREADPNVPDENEDFDDFEWGSEDDYELPF